jgi:hypothetical protein
LGGGVAGHEKQHGGDQFEIHGTSMGNSAAWTSPAADFFKFPSKNLRKASGFLKSLPFGA